MNQRRVWTAALILLTATAQAGFNMPPKSFTAGQAAEAAEAARAAGKPMAFLISDTETTCPLCADASKEIIKRLRSDAVMVYATGISALPEGVQRLVRGQDTGRFIPYVIVTDAAASTLMGIVRYEEIKENATRAFRDLDKAVKEYRKAHAVQGR